MRYFILLFLFVSVNTNLLGQDKENSSEVINEKCNCNARQFQQRYMDQLTDDKYVSEYLVGFQPDSASDNTDYVYNTMREKLKALLAKKISSKISTVESQKVSDKTVNNQSTTTLDYSSHYKSESNVELSGTEFRFCPDKKQTNTFHGVIFINKAQFLSSQFSLYKISLKDLEAQVNILVKNSMDYSPKQLAAQVSECNKKKAKIDQIEVVYASLSTKDDLARDPDVIRLNESVVPKLAQLNKRVFNKDVEKKVDSVKHYLTAKKFPEAMNIIEQVLYVNPDFEQMKELHKQCINNWSEDAIYKIDEYIRNNELDEAIDFITKTLSYKIDVKEMNDRLNSTSILFFNDYAVKIQHKIDVKDVTTAKKYLKKIQPYAKVDQQKYNELSNAISKLDW